MPLTRGCVMVAGCALVSVPPLPRLGTGRVVLCSGTFVGDALGMQFEGAAHGAIPADVEMVDRIDSGPLA